jgi:outer membrane protein TolC
MPKFPRLIAAFVPFALFAGCVSYQPMPLDRDAELAALRATALDGLVVEHARPGEGQGAAATRIDPTDGLDDDELVAVALTLNPALKAKRLSTGDAQARLIEAGLWPNPVVGGSWRPGIGSASGHAVDADLLVDLLQPWQRSARIDAATARAGEVAADVVADEWRLVRDVRLRRLDVVAAEQSLALFDEETALRERVRDLTVRQRAAGEGTELSVSAAELDLAELRRDRMRAESDLQTARRALNEILGLPPGYALRLTASGKPLVVTVFDGLSDDELERRLVAGRFELRALEAAYAAAEQDLRLAVQRQFPDLKIGLTYSRDSDGSKYLGPGAELEIPLFDRNQGGIAAALSARDRARAEFVATLFRLRAEAYEARAQLERARLEVELQEKDVLPLVRRNEALVEQGLSAHEVNVLDRVASQERALRARQAYLESVVRYQRNVVEVETATGTALARPAVVSVPKQQ